MQLNTLYNKEYIVSILTLLSQQAKKDENKYYDPALGDDTILDKRKALIDCWREYFKVLMPIYINKKNINKDKWSLIEHIHLVFGNEISQMTRILYGNALFFRVGITTLYNNIEKHKKYEPKQ